MAATTTIQVGTLDQLDAAIAYVDGQTTGSFTIQLTANINEGTSATIAAGGSQQLTYGAYANGAAATSTVAGNALPVNARQDLYALNLNSGVSVTIDGTNPQGGANFAIDGSANGNGTATYRGVFVYAGAVTLSNITIQNALARGGDGAGGGAGLGGGLFVAGTGNSNAGGKAASGAVVLSNVRFMHDAASGGSSVDQGGAGSGGGGLGGNASSGLTTGSGGGVGAGSSGGDSGDPVNNGSAGVGGIVLGASAGGSGGGGDGNTGGGGGNFGGGGGGGITATSNGGGGGVGGGTGTSNRDGGNGGFGGGGGEVGAGGFGGGEGLDDQGGAGGGFGGGGGDLGGDGGGGFGAGDNGGGGLGAGGGVFVQSGGTLTVSGTLADSGGTVAAGASNVGGGTGQRFASGFYFQGTNAPGALTFNTQDLTTGAATTQTVSDVIGDDTGSAAAAGYTGPNRYTPGSVGLVKTGIGTLDLTAANTYTGGTTLNGGTLELGQQSSAGTGAITFGTGAETLRLDFAGSTAAPVMGFAAGDDLDLTAVSSAATDSYANGVLTVSDDTNTDQITIAAAPSGDEYKISNDGNNHALVTLAAIPSPAFTTPAQDSDTNNNKPTISGTGVSGDTVDLTISNGNGNPTTVAVPVTNGVWSYTPGTALPDGNYAVFARQTSPSGTGSSSQVADGFTIDTTLSTPTITFAASNSAAGAADINAAHAASAGYTVASVDADATATVTFMGTLKSTGAAGTVAGDGTNGSHTVDLSGFQDGTVTASISDADAAGNTAAGQGASTTLDTTQPAITAVSDSGTGIDANGNGDLGAGKTVTLTVTSSEPVFVQGGTPTLTLNDGGTASYTGGSGTTALTFAYTVAAGQNTAKLAVSAVNANGATVTDGAGNPISTSLAGAAVPSGALVIDTTAPVASSPTLTVAQNAAATPIGIAAPSDNLTAAGSLAIVAGSLPTDGTVTLGDGTTPVTAGQTLTAAQLSGLEFTPTPGVSNQGSTFTYRVTDGAGNASQGTAALNVGAAGAPTITGTHVTIDGSEAAVAPFTGVTVSDPNVGTDTLTITLQNGGGTLAGTGLVSNPNGTYTLAGSAATVTQQLDALSFTPTAPPPGTSATTTFVLSDVTSAGTSVTDVGTSVTDTASAAPPPPPAPPSPDAVSIDPTVTYKNGVFTLTGTASSASGVSSVEISADVDGTRQDLGAATLNANGTFAFSDAVGDQQSFFVATLTDGAGGQAMSADPGFNLTGGLGPTGGGGKAEDFDATGQVSTTLYRSNGSRTVGIDAPGQTVDLQPFDVVGNHHEAGTSFVFNRGDGLDVIDGFKVGGAGHDTLELPASDFTNLADVLRHTGDVQGSAFITDPKTGDAIRLAGVSTAELKAHPKDFSFHA